MDVFKTLILDTSDSLTSLTGTLPVTSGGTGRTTSTTAYGLIAAGTTATGALQTLPTGATTQLLVGGGASALPVWTTATGSGSPVRATSPTLVTPVLGAATATSINGNTFTTGTYTLTGTAGKTLTFSNTLTLAGTDSTTMTFPSTSATIARTDAAQTFTGTQTINTIYSPAGSALALGTGSVGTAISIASATRAVTISTAGEAATATLLTVQNDSLTTGKLASFVSNNGTATHTGNLVEIINDFNAGATAPLLYMRQDDDGPGLVIEMTRSGNGIQSASGTALKIGTASFGTALTFASATGAATFTGTVTHSSTTVFSGALTYGGVTLSNAVTGTGNMVLSASPTFTGTLNAAAGTFTGTLLAQSATAPLVHIKATADGITPVLRFEGWDRNWYQGAVDGGADETWQVSTSSTFATTGLSLNPSTNTLTIGGGLIIGAGGSINTIVGGAGNMTITAGTGNSRTLALQSTTSGGVATTFLTGNADQSVTFAAGATFAGVTIFKSYTVAALPTASSYTYGIVFVSDATNAAGANIGTAPTGGGSVKRAVYSDGTNWLLL